MYRYVLPSEQGAWVPIRSEDLEARIKELDAKKVTILEVSELVEDGRDRKSYSYRGPLYFDIDCKGDLALAIESGRKLADKLIDLGVPQQGVRIYASGSKGIHITVDQKYFSSGRPIKGLPLVYKAMAKELYVPGLDFAVYSCGRGNAFRVVNVQRDDGKYRVPLMYDELSTLSVEQYRELTAGPRNVAIIEPAPVKATLLALMFDEARKEVNTLAPPTVIVSSKEGVEELAREVPPCVQRLVDWKGIRPERNLNQVAMQLGIYLARSKVSDVIADGLISRLVDNSKSSKYDSLRAKQEHIMGQIGFMATAEDYHFSCPSMRSMLEKPPCHGCPLENSPESGSSASAMQGLVERDDGMYVISSRTEKMLTNFSMLPTDHYIEIPRDGATGRRVGTRMELYEKEELVATVMFQESSWLSRSAFMRDTTEGHGVLMFFGTDNDVQKIKGHVLNKEQTMGEIYRVHTCGTHLEFIGKTEILTYVEPDMSINSNRIQGTHELAGEVVARPYFSHTNICAAADADADDAPTCSPGLAWNRAAGGVLGAMDTMYQRSKIQDESLYYESRKHDGSLPLVGVNTFLPPPGQEETIEERELMRSSEEEKRQQIDNLAAFQARHGAETPEALAQLQRVAEQRGNLFAEMMETVKVASLGQVSGALYEVGGIYRRNM
jgi:hypothetical protein